MSISKARASLPQLLDRVQAGEEVIITRHGRAVAVLVAPDALRVRRADEALRRAGEVRELLEAARQVPVRPSGRMSQDRADALVAEIRSARDGR